MPPDAGRISLARRCRLPDVPPTLRPGARPVALSTTALAGHAAGGARPSRLALGQRRLRRNDCAAPGVSLLRLPHAGHPASTQHAGGGNSPAGRKGRTHRPPAAKRCAGRYDDERSPGKLCLFCNSPSKPRRHERTQARGQRSTSVSAGSFRNCSSTAASGVTFFWRRSLFSSSHWRHRCLPRSSSTRSSCTRRAAR